VAPARNRTLQRALVLAGLAAAVPAWAGPEPAPGTVDLRWRLEADRLLPFRTSKVEGEGAAERVVPTAEPAHGVYGFEVPGGRDWQPEVLRIGHLPFHLACRLPERLPRGKPVEASHVYARAWDHVPVRARGTWEVRPTDFDGEVDVVGAFDLSPADAIAKAVWHVAKGRVSVRVRWDLAAGLPRSIRYGWSWERRRAVPVDKEPPATTEERAYLLEALPVRRPDAPEFQPDVDATIARGVEAIRRGQKPSGRWAAWYDYECGPTALALLTLLESEVDAADPAVARGMAWLLGQRPKKTYEVALSMMAVDAWRTPPTERRLRRRGQAVPAPIRRLEPAERAFLERCVALLASNAERNGAAAGIGYEADRPDLSNTQYAALGLRAAATCGVEVPDRLWARLLDYALRCQETEGPTSSVDVEREADKPGATRAAWRVPARGAGYENPRRPTASMTAAAIGTVLLAEEGLHRSRSPQRRRLLKDADGAVRSAFAWLSAHWSVRRPWDTEDDRVTYTLYGLERACVLEGVRRLGGRDWYREGALWLLHVQREDGSFPGHLHDTCFALLFLKRATAPRVTTGG
jgi:hypothetical protein